MISIETLFNKYNEIILANKETCLMEYDRMMKEVKESPAQYKGKPVEFLYQPMFLRKIDIERFQQLTKQFMIILKKVVENYLKDENFRSYFGFTSLLEKLLLKDPGYNPYIPMGRFDIFYHFNGDFQFCELNTDGSSGMVEARELERIFKNTLGMKELGKNYTFKGFELFDSWVKALLKNYREFSKIDKNPRVAIVDLFNEPIPEEFIEFKKAFEKADCSTVIADIRDLKYKNKKLYYKDFHIDCIYRRIVTWEIIENAHAVQDFIQAYLEGSVCVVGSIRSQIIHNKNIFAVLHDPMKTPFLNEEEREFIQKHIPHTVFFDAQDENLAAFAVQNKDQLVLKPMDRYASHGVCVGKDYSPQEWIKIIEEKAQKDYLLQRFCDVPNMPMVMLQADEIKLVDSNYILGLYMYNEKLQGIYTRTGTKNVIGSIVECFTLPVYLVEEEN
jgi:glutathionylspermidine synthase